MRHRVTITTVTNAEPDLERFVAALLAFVLARRAAEAAKREQAPRGRDA